MVKKQKKKKKVLITGANGFVGSNLTKYLGKDPNLEIYSMVRPNAPINFLKDFQFKQNNNEKVKSFKIVEANLYDEDSILKISEKMDVIVHLAGYVKDWGKKEKFIQLNVKGTEKILKAATLKGVSRVIFLSSLSVHGFRNNKSYKDENTPRNVKNFPYGETKKICEDLVESWVKKNSGKGVDSAIIRPGYIIYGEYDKNSFIQALEAILSGKFGFVDKGKKLISFVYVENLCYGISKLIKAKKVSGAYNVLDGNITWKKWVDSWANIANEKPPRLDVPYWLIYPLTAILVGIYKLFRIKKSPILNFYRIKIPHSDLSYSNKRLINEIGYEPPIKFEESLKRTFEYYQSL